MVSVCERLLCRRSKVATLFCFSATIALLVRSLARVCLSRSRFIRIASRRGSRVVSSGSDYLIVKCNFSCNFYLKKEFSVLFVVQSSAGKQSRRWKLEPYHQLPYERRKKNLVKRTESSHALHTFVKAWYFFHKLAGLTVVL